MNELSDPRPIAIPTPGLFSAPALSLPTDAFLIVGVTAHRDLTPALVPQLEADVRAFLLRMRGLHPQLSVAVMSGLAEGGDRLVARCAIALGMPLLAPLPLSREDYFTDCSSAESVEELRDLLAQAQVIELPLADGNDEQSIRMQGAARDRQYAQLGVYVSSHCQVLLALWDGKPSDAAGGTSDVLHYHLFGEMPGLGAADAPPNLLADDDSDLAFHIFCPRDRPGGEVDAPLSSRWMTRNENLPGTGPMPENYDRLFNQLGEFNADAKLYAEEIAQTSRSLLPAPEEIRCSGAILRIDAMYQRADWLALHFRKRVHHSMLLLHVLAVLTGLLLMTYSEFVAQPALLAALLGFFAVGVAVAWLGERRSWHRRYLDYRVLAEGLRVQCYWTIAGVPSSHRVRFAYDSFLQKQDVELGWIRHAMRAVGLGGGTPISDVGLRWVVANWVGDGGSLGQLGYFRRRTAEREVKYQHTERIGKASLMLSLACAIFLLVFGGWLGPTTSKLFLVTAGMTALFAGVREAYSHKLADKELIKQYRFMTRVFASASELLARDTDAFKQRRVLEALGEAALEEHAEWILMHRERPLEQSRLG
jgi:hypothetical protein